MKINSEITIPPVSYWVSLSVHTESDHQTEKSTNISAHKKDVQFPIRFQGYTNHKKAIRQQNPQKNKQHTAG